MFPSGFLFLIIVLIIDLVLKSSKNKKAAEKEERRKVNTSPEEKTSKSTRRTIEQKIIEEFSQSKEREVKEKREARKEARIESRKKARIEEEKAQQQMSKSRPVESRKEDLDLGRIEIGDSIKGSELRSGEIGKKDSKENLKKNLLNGIIFSEILSKPKSMKK